MGNIRNSSSTKMLQLIVIILFTHMYIHFSHASNSRCLQIEREALMEFRGSLIDKNNLLSSWTGRDCCSWYGVTCHNLTGHVQEIDLMATYGSPFSLCYGECILGGHINSSLLKLEHLEYLDLSYNDFEGLSIPSFLGSLRNLKYLNLLGARFAGEIPQQLGNLTNLQYLSLGGFNSHLSLSVKGLNWITGISSLQTLELHCTSLSDYVESLGNLTNLQYLYLGGDSTSLSVKGLNWITGLSSLQTLELQKMNLSDSVDWLHSLSKLSSLSSLGLYYCELPSTIRSDVSYINLTSLLSLVLDGTYIGYILPPWFYNITNLKFLAMHSSGLLGSISNKFEKLTTPNFLDLSSNSLGYTFPNSLCSLTRLTHVFLIENNLHGSLPSCLANLTSLVDLFLAGNKLNGEIPSELGNLTQLINLDLSTNQLTGKFPLNFGNLTNLQWLDVSKNFLTGELLESSLVGLTSLRALIISRNPFLFLNVSSQWIPPFQIFQFEMDHVIINTQLFPYWLRTQRNLNVLVMSNANITGSIPNEICNFRKLYILSLASNRITGKIPLCLGILLHLELLDLSNNRLSGQIPVELGSLQYLTILHLNGNNLFGELPTSFQNLTELVTFDVGENELRGCIPEWIGKEFSRLEYLRLESNNFSCEISINLCMLPSLHILNMAHNNVVGTIPPCLGNFSRMSEYEPSYRGYTDILLNHSGYTDTLLNYIKGTELEYSSTLAYAKFISLSGNHLHGEIPEELMNIIGLQSLDLSNNELSGRIPESIGNLKHLESLDLSMNQISGTIPQSLASIDSLAYLNLSFNKLEGKIPSGNHFDTLIHPSSYEGNSGLCGKLLNRSCPGNDRSVQSTKENGPDSDDDNGEFEWAWLYAGTAPGFAVGFLGVILILYFNKAWRYAYFRFLDNACDRVWVTFAIKIPEFTRKFK